MAKPPFQSFPPYLAKAAESFPGELRDVAVRVARAQPAVATLSSLIRQALIHPEPPADTIRRCRELTTGLAVAAIAAMHMLEEIDDDAHAHLGKPPFDGHEKDTELE